ncbi:MAG: hypothetical protein QN149_10905 [Armatimonadota bacterium]|nr:hypothetical protein [Armatimonadota bacterium]MDR7452155.1 hypothetical protein [Armatimonadota bacterium]MDR7494880.1 hypothetical protein [Armatimonadota bacterium]MDR7547773.1 hypothetical protein [Armatimonadota bacterium]
MADGPAFPLDIKVLAHLRGYPEELRRYSNLIKQGHPRGISAVEFLLRRPPSGDFVEAIARAVQGGEEVVTAVEAAEMAGISPKALLEELAARPDFPAPLYRKEHRALWRRAEVQAYLDRRDG